MSVKNSKPKSIGKSLIKPGYRFEYFSDRMGRKNLKNYEMIGNGMVCLKRASWAPIAEGLLEDQQRIVGSCANVTLCCQDGQVPVHRLLIIQASSYIKKLLESRENDEDSAVIFLEDVNVRNLFQVVQLIYTGTTTIEEQDHVPLSSLLMDVFKISVDRMDVKLLKKVPQDQFSRQISCVVSSSHKLQNETTQQTSKNGKRGPKRRQIETMQKDIVNSEETPTINEENKKRRRGRKPNQVQTIEVASLTITTIAAPQIKRRRGPKKRQETTATNNTPTASANNNTQSCDAAAATPKFLKQVIVNGIIYNYYCKGGDTKKAIAIRADKDKYITDKL